MKALGKAISRALFANVKRLYMNNNNIGSEGVEVFAAAVAETEGNKLDTLEARTPLNHSIGLVDVCLRWPVRTHTPG